MGSISVSKLARMHGMTVEAAVSRLRAAGMSVQGSDPFVDREAALAVLPLPERVPAPSDLHPDDEVRLGADEMYCSDCGTVIRRRAEICPHCGVRQHAPPPAQVVVHAAKSSGGSLLNAALRALAIVGVLALTSFGGALSFFADLLGGNPGAGLAAMLGVSFLGLEFWLAVGALFAPRRAAVGIIGVALLAVIPAALLGGIANAFLQCIIAVCGLLLRGNAPDTEQVA